MIHTSPRFVASALVACLLVGAAHAAKPVEWKKVTTPSFTVMTPLDQKKAGVWVDEFSQFVAALQAFIPVEPARLPKLTVVLFPRTKDFARYRPLASDGKPADVGGFFARADGWAVAGLAVDGLDGESRQTFNHEGTHWYLSGFDTPNPVWLEEGLAEVFSTFEVEYKTVVWGKPVEAHTYVLSEIRQMPLQELLSLKQKDLFVPGAKGELRTGLAYAQSWAFVHYLLFGKSDLPPSALNGFLNAMRRMDAERAFATAFGRSPAEIDLRLAGYVRDGQYYMSRRPLASVPAATIEIARQEEVESALARLALVGGHTKEALQHAEAAVQASQESPLGYEALAMVRDVMDEPEPALAAYKAAVARKTRDFRPYFEVAKAAQEDALKEQESGLKISPVRARLIANNYERAINLHPRFEPAYTWLATILEPAGTVTEEDAGFLKLGAAAFPENMLIRVGLAVAERKAGRPEAALKILENVLARAEVGSPAHSYASGLREAWRGQAAR